MPSLISVNNVYKTYTTNNNVVHAVQGVSFDINTGEIFSLLGVNGAGKTTVSSLLATLHPVTSGTILCNGTSIYNDIFSYRRALGYCPQKQNLDPFLSVRDNLMFAGRYFLMSESEIQERVKQLLNDLALEQYAHYTINQLSGGTKQKVLIARALVHKPQFIILDEPTVGLDPDIRRKLWDLIKQLKHMGISVLLTTHYLDEADYLSDRICVLHKGKVVLTETISSLKQQRQKERLEDIFLDIMQEQGE